MDRMLTTIIGATRDAGQEILSFYHHEFSVRDKSPDNPVTEADVASDRLLKERLALSFPDTGWLSEETADNPDRLQHNVCWIVDPLDGTKEFIKGIPEFAVSIALVEDGKPRLGVVYNPVTGELFHALRGKGSFLNNQRIRVSRQTIMKEAKVEASRSERNRGEFESFEDSVSVRTMGSIAYKLARLAAGYSDATWSRGPKNEWDICAGLLMVEEAGGRCVDLDFNPIRFNQPYPKVNGIIATNGLLHPKICDLLTPHRASARIDANNWNKL